MDPRLEDAPVAVCRRSGAELGTEGRSIEPVDASRDASPGAFPFDFHLDPKASVDHAWSGKQTTPERRVEFYAAAARKYRG